MTFTIRFALTLSLVFTCLLASYAIAQENKDEIGAIEIYDGPPIYLDQPEAPPAPIEVESRDSKVKYKDSEDIRFERRMIRFSDDTFTSDGPYKEFYKGGQIFSEGAFNRGKMEGPWKFYHTNGQLAKEITFDAGHPNGAVKVYDDAGQLVAERNYDQGKRSGTWKVYDTKEGVQTSEQTYTNGKANGVWKVWYKSGQLRQEQNFKDGKLNGKVTEWSTTGDKSGEATFVEGKMEGTNTIWRANGEVIERIYEDGKLKSQTKTPAK